MSDSTAHDFFESNEWSHKAADHPFMGHVLRTCYGESVKYTYNREDGPEQRRGEDFSIFLECFAWKLKSGADTKFRWPIGNGGSVPRDILFEEQSSIERDTPGWIVKTEVLCDEIIYLILGLGHGYRFQREYLQKAWLKHRDQWKAEHAKGHPEGFLTKNVSGNTSRNWAVTSEQLTKSGVMFDFFLFPIPSDLIQAWCLFQTRLAREKKLAVAAL